MRLQGIRERLATIPEQLPPMPRQLMPIALGLTDGEPPLIPSFPDRPRREAAVLILFYADEAGEAHLVLTERSPGEHRHAGQISLPGGQIDDTDESVEAAA